MSAGYVAMINADSVEEPSGFVAAIVDGVEAHGAPSRWVIVDLGGRARFITMIPGGDRAMFESEDVCEQRLGYSSDVFGWQA